MKTIIYILVSLILNGFILSYILDIRLIDHDLIPIKEQPIMQEETSKLPEVEKIDQSGAPYETKRPESVYSLTLISSFSLIFWSNSRCCCSLIVAKVPY